MNPVEQPLELSLKKEARHRELLDMHSKKEWDCLLDAAALLNDALYTQQVMNRWLAKEAADNLAAAWQAGKVPQPEHDGSGC